MLNRLKRIVDQKLRRSTAVYCGNNLVLTRLRTGQKMYVDSRDRSLAPHLIMDGDWEPWIADVVRNHVKPGMSVVEVGANVGFYSLLIARAVSPTGKLRSFEANPHLATLVQQNLHINGHDPYSESVLVSAMAVADTEGPRKFYTFDAYKGGSSLLDVASVGADQRAEIEVPCTTLDIALADFGPIDFMKIDAEGAEIMILTGAAEVIRRSPNMRMVIEFQPKQELYDLLTGHGFKISPITIDKPLAPASFAEMARIGTCDALISR